MDSMHLFACESSGFKESAPLSSNSNGARRRSVQASVLEHIRRVLESHLAFSLERVFTREAGKTLDERMGMLVPDIWVATLSINPVKTRTVVEPSLVIEIQPPATGAAKFLARTRAYRTIEAVREVVIVVPVERSIEVFRRRAKGRWSLESYSGDEHFELSTIGLMTSVEKFFPTVADACSRMATARCTSHRQSSEPTI